MKFGRHKTCRRVLLKLVFVWCLSLACSLPLSLMYATDSESTIVHGSCQIPTSLFQIIGSVICFYIPLIIMLLTYALTVRLLSVQKMQLLNGKVPKNYFSKYHKSRKMRNIVSKTSSSATDPGDTASEYALRETEVMNNISKVNCSINSMSPIRRSPTVGYNSPENIRLAQLRTRKCSSTRRHGERSLELTVFPSKDRSHEEVKELCQYSLREFSKSNEQSSHASSSSHIEQTEEVPDSRPECSENINEVEVVQIPTTANKDSGETLATECHTQRKDVHDNKLAVGIRLANLQDEESKCEDFSETPVTIPCSCAPRSVFSI